MFFPLLISWNIAWAQQCDINQCVDSVAKCTLVGVVEHPPGANTKPYYDGSTGACHGCDPIKERAANNGQCPCCEQCARCFGDRFDQCCDCIDMCWYTEETPPVQQHMQISVLHFQTNEAEVERFRDHTDIYVEKLFNVKFDVYHRDQIVTDSTDTHPRQAFWENCMPYSECATNCQSMGAGHTRWFHSDSNGVGCCECLDPRIKPSHLNHETARPMCKYCQSLDNFL